MAVLGALDVSKACLQDHDLASRRGKRGSKSRGRRGAVAGKGADGLAKVGPAERWWHVVQLELTRAYRQSLGGSPDRNAGGGGFRPVDGVSSTIVELLGKQGEMGPCGDQLNVPLLLRGVVATHPSHDGHVRQEGAEVLSQEVFEGAELFQGNRCADLEDVDM